MTLPVQLDLFDEPQSGAEAAPAALNRANLGTFQDSLRVFRETFRVLKPGASFLLILGDSAPYGVPVPTETYLGEIGKAVDFARYEIEELRTRGGKWRDNPQRHKMPLKECILTFYKGFPARKSYLRAAS